MEDKKIRNPFPSLGKVFKYEFLNSYRVLLPIYAAVLVVALLAGVFILGPEIKNEFIDAASSTAPSWFKGLLGFLCVVVYIASFAVTLVYLEKRFKHGMLGDEAYLNMSLPVTVGEHVWGRALVAFVWSLIYTVIIALSVILLFIRVLDSETIGYIIDALMDEDFSISFMFAMICFGISGFLLIVMFCYVVNAISHLAKKHRKLIEVVVAVLLIILVGHLGYSWIDSMAYNIGTTAEAASVIWLVDLMNVVYAVVFGVVTQLILQFRMNLE